MTTTIMISPDGTVSMAPYGGGAPYRFADLEPSLVGAFLDMPPLASGAIYRGLSEEDRNNLIQFCVSMGVAFTQRIKYLTDNFAAFAFPDTGVWPVPSNDHILEETIVDVQPIASILCCLDGSRYVTPVSGDYSRLQTFAEFRAAHEISVADYLDTILSQETHRINRVMQLVGVETPTEVIEVTYAAATDNGDATAVGRLLARQYLPDQITAYCHRRRFTITSTTPMKDSANAPQ